MITEFVTRFMVHKPALEETFRTSPPVNYRQLVEQVITAIALPDVYGDLDPTRIHQIDDGGCSGTLVFVIAANNYEPSDYWYLKMAYGSSSVCDTLERIHDVPGAPALTALTATPSQVADFMMLALHVVQGLRAMGDFE